MEDEYVGYKGRNYYCKNPPGWKEAYGNIVSVEVHPEMIYKKWIETKIKETGLKKYILHKRPINILDLLKKYEHVPILLPNHKADWKICVICGAVYTGNEPFCSGPCSIKYCIQNGIWYQRVKLKGYSPTYCKKFNYDLKLRVRAFFNYTCFLCGKSETENGKKLSVHHVNYDKMVCCNDKPVKLVPLCSSCHPKTNANRKYWENLIEFELEQKYNSKCYFTKKEFSIIESDNYNSDGLCTSMNT
jgi:hypothetical protein